MVSLRKGCNKRGGYPQHIEQRRAGAATRWGIASEKQGLQVRGVQCMLGNSDWQRQKLGIWGLFFFYKRLFLSDYFCIFSSEFLWFFGNTNICSLHHKPCMYCKQPFSLPLSVFNLGLQWSRNGKQGGKPSVYSLLQNWILLPVKTAALLDLLRWDQNKVTDDWCAF